MSAPEAVLIVAPPGNREAAGALAERLACAVWPDSGTSGLLIEPHVWPRNGTLPQLFRPATALVVIDDGSAPRRELRALLHAAAYEALPVVIVGEACADGHLSGCLRVDAETAPESIAAALAGLLARGAEMTRLQDEVRLTTRVAEGVQADLIRRDEELQLASLIQREFLPRAPAPVEGMEFAALWRPASSVSGDVYDIVRLDEHRVGIFLADAVGHGVSAALLAMQLCRSLVTVEPQQRFRRVVPPAEAMARLNDDMADRQGCVGRYATASYAVLDCRERVLTVACAGGPAPLVLSPSAGVRSPGAGLRRLEATGPLLGLVPHATFTEATRVLAPDDRVLFHSDGFERIFREETTDADRFLDEFALLAREGSAERAVDAVAGRIDGAKGSLHPEDDCTLIVVRALPIEARLAA